MKKWKIIHIHVVEAPTRDEALALFTAAIQNGTVDDYFQNMIVKKEDDSPKGWGGTLKSQLTG